MKRFFSLWPLMIVLLLSLTPILWFIGKGSVLINGVDTNFPLDPIVWFGRRFFVWSDTGNAGADFSSSTAGLFFHFVQYLPYKLGFNLQYTEIFSLIFWFSMILLGAFYLSRILLPKKSHLQVLFVILYGFNTYLFNSWENVKVSNLALVAALPFALAILLQLRNGQISKVRAGFYSVVTGILFSGSGINPSYFFCLILSLFLFFIAEIIVDHNRGSFVSSLKNLLIVTCLMTMVNMFWILPTTNFILKNISGSGSIDKLGLTNWVDSLSENTSLINVLRLQGAWDWYTVDSISNLPIYIPYALNYFFNPFFIIFSLILPALALLSFALMNRKGLDLYLAFGFMIIVGIFLGAGTHEPSGSIFRLLINHLPFFTIFRSPWYIFTPLVTLAYAGLISLLFLNLEEDLNLNKYRFSKLALLLIVILIGVGNLIYSYPLVTGKIFRPNRKDGFFINFPNYIFEAKKWLDQNTTGRIISYPDDEIENFDWNYRGIESILELFSNTEILFAPLNSPDAPIAKIVKEYYRNLKLGQIEATNNLAAKLNVEYLFNKTDERSLSPELPTGIKNNLAKTFDKWEFYKLPDSNFVPKISATSKIYLSSEYKNNEAILSATPKNVVLLNQMDKVVNQISGIDTSGAAILSVNSQAAEFTAFQIAPSMLSNRLTSRDFATVIYNFAVTKSGDYQPMLEKYKLEDFGLDTSKTIQSDVDGKSVNLDIADNTSDSYIKFKPIKLDQGNHSIAFKLTNNNLITGGSFNNGYQFKQDGYGTGKAKFLIENNGASQYLSIINYDKADAQASFDFNNFDPFGAYYIEFSYKQIYGNNGLVGISQMNGNVLLKSIAERLPNYPEWNTFSFYYQPVASNSKAMLSLSAPFTSDPLGTKMLYSNVKVYKVFTNKMVLVMDNDINGLGKAEIDFNRESPVSYSGSVNNNKNNQVIIFAENYSPEWKMTLFDKDGSRLKLTPLHFTANGYANGWYVDLPQSSYKFKIYYEPQNIFLVGSSISFATILLTTIFFLSYKFRGKHV